MKSVLDGQPADLMEALRASLDRLIRPVPAPPILAVCPNPACQAGIDSPELPQACPRCGAVLTEGHA